MLQVTDYARDLEEMQNVSREEYLASLRLCVLYFTIFSSMKPSCCLFVILCAGRAVAFQEEYPNTGGSPGAILSK